VEALPRAVVAQDLRDEQLAAEVVVQHQRRHAALPT
jgi:hypothetical protein